MIREFIVAFMPLILIGCVNPYFREDVQEIHFETSNGVNLSIKDYELNQLQRVQVTRSFNSLNVILSKKGFKEKELKVKSHFTDDKWAKECSMGCSYLSSVFLLPPTQTVFWTIGGGYAGFVWPTEDLGGYTGYILSPFTTIGGITVGFIYGIGNDAWNLIRLAWPRAVFGNPWYEYDKEIDLTREILTPTPKFEKECHSEKNTFIGNNDCLTCLIEKEVISTEEECNRCSNREWSNFECRLK